MVIPTGDFQNYAGNVKANLVPRVPWERAWVKAPGPDVVNPFPRAQVNSIEWQPHRKPTQCVMIQCSVL